MAVRMILLLSLSLALITLATEREEIFLMAHGFANLADKFKEQEVTMDMLSRLSDGTSTSSAWPRWVRGTDLEILLIASIIKQTQMRTQLSKI